MKDEITTYLFERAKRGDRFSRFDCDLARAVWENHDDAPGWMAILAGAAHANETGWPVDLAGHVLADFDWEAEHDND